VLFVLVPLVALIEDGGETDDQEEGDEEDDGVEVGAMRFHVGPFVPTGSKIDDDGYNQQQSSRNADEELADNFLSAEAVGFPVADEILFPLCEHGSTLCLQSSLSLTSLKSDGLKLPQLLSQYLYQNRKLDLPGIGSFTLDADAVVPLESDRIGHMAATGIRFRNAVIPAADDNLVNFIKEHTGKMKSLAAADLDFYLTTGRQLLNIGKPFYLDGIGTLIKTKEGGFEFTPGEYMVSRLEELSSERRAAGADEPVREREAKGNSTKQGLLLVLILIGLGVIGWAGYYLYKRNSFSEPVEKQAVVLPDTAQANSAKATDTALRAVDTASKTVGKDSTEKAAPMPAALPPPPGATLYRFVILATDNKHHALRRYNQLLGYQLNIKMYQKDSAWFKLYFPIAALPRDTSYIRDSLADTYAAPNVTIEH
jgi:hypothetical protein